MLAILHCLALILERKLLLMPNLPLAEQNNIANDVKVTNFAQGFYSNNYPVSGAEFDAVKTFFLARCRGDSIAAEALTSSVLTIAYSRNIKPLSLIEDFKIYTDNQSFTAALIALLNTDRRNTSKLGYSASVTADQYVTRNIGS